MEKRIVDAEQMKQQEQETRRCAIDDLEKHVKHSVIKSFSLFVTNFYLVSFGRLLNTGILF